MSMLDKQKEDIDMGMTYEAEPRIAEREVG
jgi:hypothetical protein